MYIILKDKTWQVKAQLIDSLKYLHAKHIIKGHKLIRQTHNMINHQGASSCFLVVCMNIKLWIPVGICPLPLPLGSPSSS